MVSEKSIVEDNERLERLEHSESTNTGSNTELSVNSKVGKGGGCWAFRKGTTVNNGANERAVKGAESQMMKVVDTRFRDSKMSTHRDFAAKDTREKATRPGRSFYTRATIFSYLQSPRVDSENKRIIACPIRTTI